MIVFPCAKINLGLNVVARREDGYHDIETVFYPIPLADRLELTVENDENVAENRCFLSVNGAKIDCDNNDNLIVKAYNLLAKDYHLPCIKASLNKNIPMQAGLGGGSSDAAYTLKALNEMLSLGIDDDNLRRYASRLGADCPFFITPQTAFATGIGDVLSPIDNSNLLHGYHLLLVKPDVSVSTKEAYQMIVPQRPALCCKDVLTLPVPEWRHHLYNDFEPPVFCKHTILSEIKEKLYHLGAVYAQMSGSGSIIFALFNNSPKQFERHFDNCFVFSTLL